ncbi:hypothetical protein R1sor_025843 [Riccia sorocarpa]|uniref:Probable glucan 1,3-alpha-glucosidase n=1 Tax=Riccia sorocarpa TaxID=122646 RepID=A0ABD3GCZ4_9MARC
MEVGDMDRWRQKKNGFLALGLVLLVVAVTGAHAWKKDEFKRCDQTIFCREYRNLDIGSSKWYVSDVNLTNGKVRARLVNEDDGEAEHGGSLILHLSAYQDGIVRVKVKEADQKKKRFEVPDVIVKELEEKRLWIQRLIEKDGASMVVLSGHEVVLLHKPFQLYVRNGKETLLSLNAKGLFHFERQREKREGENWDDTFRSHTDTRPHGPQSIGFDVSFYGADFVYGLPERATGLTLKPTKGAEIVSEPYRLFNSDIFEYIYESPFGLYGAVPVMQSHGEKRTTGFFWLNAAEMVVDVLAKEKAEEGAAEEVSRVDTHWMAESGAFDAFFFIGPGPKDVIRQYTSVTGKSIMPQFFATAYHQCRWNYKDEADVFQVDAGFDEYDMPYDVLWLDIEHTDGKKYFTWDPVLFPNPKEMQDKIAAKGRKMVTIIDPHIKRDNNYYIHKEAQSKGYYIKNKHGADFDGWCWPGSSSYLDMLNPEVRSWWADKFSYSSYQGSTPNLYIWNDMNEPSVFNGPEATMERDNIHYGGVEHRDVHNAYGYYFHMASVEGLMKRGENNDRPFVLSRSFFAGTQKVGAIWTGDNNADWDHLRVSVPMLLTLGLTGITFAGADVGGFFGNPDAELLTRWYQLGAYYPFYRGHAHLDTKRREPWLFGEPYTSLIRESLHTRYALLPYFYTLFREANVNGLPLMRPLWMEYPSDKHSFAIDDEFLLGKDILVHGVYSEKAVSEEVYFPGSQPWFDVRTGASYSGGQTVQVPVTLDSIPVYQRAGSIIPRKDRFRRSSFQMENDPYTLVIALNGTYEARGELYIDDGKSFDFEKGAYIHRLFTFADGRLTSTNLAPGNKGTKEFTTSCLVERIILLGLKSKDLSSHRVLVESSGTQVSAEIGPSLLRKGYHQTNSLVVRMPKVRISDDWSIKVL